MWAEASTKFNVVIIRNPFDISDRVIASSEFEGKSISDLISRVSCPLAISVSGGIIEPENYSTTIPQAGDAVVICPIPQGGSGGGKGILRLVAIIALTVVSGGIAAGTILPGLGGAAGSITSMAAAGALMVGGTLLVNAILPPIVPKAPSFNNSTDSPTYGADGAKNTSLEGVAYPVCYGEHRMAGNRIGTYTENVGTDQYLYLLINAGEGEIAGIRDIEINKQPISYYKDVQVRKVLGTADQQPIGWFNKTITPVSASVPLSRQVVTRRTNGEVDALRLDFVFQGGLYHLKKDGTRVNSSVTINAVIKNVATGQSITKKLVVTSRTNATLRRSVLFDDLPQGKYTVDVSRTTDVSKSQTTSNAVSLIDINEIVNETINYKHTALLALRIKMTNQLNNIPNVTFINEGLLIKVWDKTLRKLVRKASSNPAWAAYDGMTNTRYGGSIAESSINLKKFITWANFADSQGLTFNGVLDGVSGLWDALQPIMRIGHGKIVMMGTKYSVSVEMPDSPKMMYSQANMIEGSFSIDWLGTQDRANEVEVIFYDKNNSYKPKPVRVYDGEALAKGQIQRLVSITLLGCDNEETAYYEAELALNMNKYILQTVSFDVYIDSISSEIGDVVYVQHNMPKWGNSGRLNSKSTESILVIDEDVTEADTVLVARSAQIIKTCKVTRQTANIVYLDTMTADMKPKRAVTASGEDIPVLDSYYGTGVGWGVILDTDATFPIDSVIELWDTEIMEERSCWVGDDGLVNLHTPLSEPPDFDANYMIGKSGKVKKPFRILGINGNSDFVRTITAIEYNESVYDRSQQFASTHNYSNFKSFTGSSIDDVSERLIGLTGLDTEITVDFSNDHNQYLNSSIEVSFDGGATFDEKGSSSNQVKFYASTGDQLLIKAVARSVSGLIAPANQIAEYSYSVQGKITPPANVANLEWIVEQGGIALSWDPVADIDVKGYVVRKGLAWESGTAVNSLVQTANLSIPLSLTVSDTYHVRAIDLGGRLSVESAIIDVVLNKPPPVLGFNAIRNGPQISMTWSLSPDSNVSEYELREGDTWLKSALVTVTSGSSYALPTKGGNIRRFWIKARHISGLASVDAMFASVVDQVVQLKNVLHTTDEKADGWPGVSLNTRRLPGNSGLVMTDNSLYAEYFLPISLAKPVTAHNTLEMNIDAAIGSPPSMSELNYPFSDVRAGISYSGGASGADLSVAQYIAKKDTNITHGVLDFALSSSVSSVQGGETSISQGIKHAKGRATHGVLSSPLSNIGWEVSLPEVFSLRAWHNYVDKSETGRLVIWRIQSAGESLLVSYFPERKCVELLGSDDKSVEVLFPLIPGDIVFMGVSQGLEKRKLLIATPNGKTAFGNVLASPIGAIDTVRMSS